MQFNDSHKLSRIYVHYVCSKNLTSQETTDYYNHVVRRDSLLKCDSLTEHTLQTDFPTARSFHLYCHSLLLLRVSEEGWSRAVISLSGCPINKTGYFRCPLRIIRSLLTSDTEPRSITPFNYGYNIDGDRLFSKPWNTDIYASGHNTVSNCEIVLIYF